ncbi:MAG TPA: T9SS type A sorting domain-containing protein [Bacteroidia bacterium]|nr:T9SS type A sorting domain-containing protein [Bacteroidia bacterium]
MIHLDTIRVFFLSLLITLQVGAQSVDQSQVNYNIPLSGRTLNGYNVFQSFTAGLTGTLVGIELVFVDSMIGSAALKLYTGADTSGMLLQTSPGTVSCQNSPCIMNFSLSAAVVSGQQYSFRFIPGPGITDPYFLQGERPGTYAGGKMGFINPFLMGHPPLDPDLVFKTFVLQEATGFGVTVTQQLSILIFPNPAKENMEILLENNYAAMDVTELSITGVLGQIIKNQRILPGQSNIQIEGLPAGIYFFSLKNSKRQTLSTKKIIIH